MRHITAILLCLLAFILSMGCLNKDIPAEDVLGHMRHDYDQARTRQYDNVTVDELALFCRRIFKLADPSYQVITGGNGLVAYKTRTMRSPAAYWYVSIIEGNNKVAIRVRQTSSADNATQLTPDPMTGTRYLVGKRSVDPRETTLEELQSTAVYLTFFKRLEYFLGRTNIWLYCRAAEEFVIMENASGSLDALCKGTVDAQP